MKVLKPILICALAAVLAAAVFFAVKNGGDAPAAAASASAPSAASAVTVTEATASNYTATVTLKQNGTTYTGSGVSVDGNTVSITGAGVYRLEGTLTDGQIYVNVSGKDSVVLILGGVSVTNTSGYAIYVENSGSMALYLEEGTENTVTSGTAVEISADVSDADASGGAICFKDDATVCGTGSLAVYGYLNNGIHCSNNLFIESGTISVTAVNNGIKGKDSLTIDGGTVSVISGGDGLKSDDETGDGYGVVTVNGGDITVYSYGDAVQAQTALTVNGGTLDLTTTGTISTMTSDFGWGMPDSGWDANTSDSGSGDISTKGLKAGTSLVITGGDITVDSVDDSVHCNGDVAISGGELTLSSRDDGIHADGEVDITDGVIEILTSYEGIEGAYITVDGGNISVTASDDGFNASSGSGSTGFGLFGIAGSDLPELTINGGTILVNASGDGLDSNGDLTINGGTVIVDGPSNSGNGSLDSGSESGGVITVNGGTLLAVGATGMVETPDSSSAQCTFSCNVSYSAGSVITVSKADGTVLIEYTAQKSGGNVIFSSPELTVGETYILTVDGSSAEITITGTVTGDTGGMGNMGGMGGPGDMGGRSSDSSGSMPSMPGDSGGFGGGPGR